MSVCGIGIDHVDIDKFSSVLGKRKERFVKKVFTDREAELAKKKNFLMTLAGRYASKEAVFKALCPDKDSGISWKDIEILNEDSGKPYVILHGKALKAFKTKNISRVFISISHTDTSAYAQVILEKD